MMGMFIRHEKDKKFVISKRINILAWFLALGLMHSVMWYRSAGQLYYGYEAKTFCYTFSKVLWLISISWMTFACFFGYGGIVDWFLSSGFMQFGSKLTYCIYLMHPVIVYNYSMGVKYRFVFSDWQAFYINCAYFILSMLVAFFWTLAFEMPMVTIEKVIFGRGRQAPKISEPKTEVSHDLQKVT